MIIDAINSIVFSYWILSYIPGYFNTLRNKTFGDFLCFFVKIFGLLGDMAKMCAGPAGVKLLTPDGLLRFFF
jgi:hypothetical protein